MTAGAPVCIQPDIFDGERLRGPEHHHQSLGPFAVCDTGIHLRGDFENRGSRYCRRQYLQNLRAPECALGDEAGLQGVPYLTYTLDGEQSRFSSGAGLLHQGQQILDAWILGGRYRFCHRGH